MLLLLMAGLMLSGTQLNAMDRDGRISFWGSPVEPQPPVAVQKMSPETSAGSDDAGLLPRLCGGNGASTYSCDPENLDAMFACDDLATQGSKVEEQNKSNLSAIGDLGIPKLPSGLEDDSNTSSEPWENFFSGSDESGSEDLASKSHRRMALSADNGLRSQSPCIQPVCGCGSRTMPRKIMSSFNPDRQYIVKRSQQETTPLRTYFEALQKQPPYIQQMMYQCEPRALVSRKIRSSFQPHKLFVLLQTNVHILDPYFKGETITALEAYIATAWLKKHRAFFLDSTRVGCPYCPPSTVLQGGCTCSMVRDDKARVELLKGKIANVVNAVRKFVAQARLHTVAFNECKRCAWAPGCEDHEVPAAVLKLAKYARKHLKIHPALDRVLTGYEADDESDDETAFKQACGGF